VPERRRYVPDHLQPWLFPTPSTVPAAALLSYFMGAYQWILYFARRTTLNSLHRPFSAGAHLLSWPQPAFMGPCLSLRRVPCSGTNGGVSGVYTTESLSHTQERYEKLKETGARKTTETDVLSARERYLARKKAKEAAGL
jgi:hypothetical protein